MKKILFSLAAVAALFTAVSCLNNEFDQLTTEEGQFIATMETPDGATKTYLGTGNCVFWNVGDSIDINGCVYTTDMDSVQRALFKPKGTKAQLSGGLYMASYPVELGSNVFPATQTFEKGRLSNIPMRACTSDNHINFQNVCGVLEFTLTGSGNVTSITVSADEYLAGPCAAFDKEDPTLKLNTSDQSACSKIITLDCGDGVTLTDEGTQFYVALVAGTYHNLTFKYKVNGQEKTFKAGNAVTIQRNKIYTVAQKIVQPVLLPGVFSVSANKKVMFTSGNLYWNGSNFKLEDSQTASPAASNDPLDQSHVGHFFWAKTASASYAATYDDGTCSTSDKFFADGSDAGHTLTVDGQGGLYALSKTEWTYLLSADGRGVGDSKFKLNVTVCGVQRCLVIAPDNYSGTIASSYDAAAWSTAESAGLVCLPPAGYRGNMGYGPTSVGSGGYYWLATPSGNETDKAYYTSFDYEDINLSIEYNRDFGCAVRLVYSVPIPVTGVTMDSPTKTIYIDSPQQLAYTVQPAGADVESVEWSTSAESVATVDQNGVVTGVSEGTGHHHRHNQRHIYSHLRGYGGRKISCRPDLLYVQPACRAGYSDSKVTWIHLGRPHRQG